jgi:endonuclease YncB( thermonuclease family)
MGTTRNLSLEMVRAGWGVVYEKHGAVYGQWGKDAYLAAQSEAQCVVQFLFVGGLAAD